MRPAGEEQEGSGLQADAWMGSSKGDETGKPDWGPS